MKELDPDLIILKELIERPGGASVPELMDAVVRNYKHVTDLILNNRHVFGNRLGATKVSEAYQRFFLYGEVS